MDLAECGHSDDFDVVTEMTLWLERACVGKNLTGGFLKNKNAGALSGRAIIGRCTQKMDPLNDGFGVPATAGDNKKPEVVVNDRILDEIAAAQEEEETMEPGEVVPASLE
jgi:hypothetical protein